ncbi:hypothetical protein EIP86_009506 [Pleurotus ostreatoroseus]|nr:hypothetical protein EIP86_009506 [Pleurotus ostreatoroseus]
MKIVHLLIQSAALYSTCLLLSLGLYLGKSNVQFVAVAVCSQVVGINFCTIMSQGRARVTSTSENTNNSLPLRSMAIRITTDTNRHTDVENQLRDSKAIVLGADAEGAEFDPSGSMSK